ncbi:hypothetical protein [Desulfoscipio sp. XC116]|uniref:hypothetical protein n=1 Tax=Desulfoscipio sp. XC116 TaxID=3144975 RepID=UPI00325B306D
MKRVEAERRIAANANREKTAVDYIGKVKFLGFAFQRCKGKARVGIHPKSVAKMRNKVKEFVSGATGWAMELNERVFLVGVIGLIVF